MSSDSGGATTLVLPRDLSIAAAEDFKRSLLDALELGAVIAIDASQVQRVGTSALQLLLAFQTEARARAVEVGWSAKSEVLAEAAALSGLNADLGFLTST